MSVLAILTKNYRTMCLAYLLLKHGADSLCNAKCMQVSMYRRHCPHYRFGLQYEKLRLANFLVSDNNL